MTRILKPIKIDNIARLAQICAVYFSDQYGVSIIDYHVCSGDRGSIDILATQGKKIYLMNISKSDFATTLLYSFLGYRWYQENMDFLLRTYGSKGLSTDNSPVLVILSADLDMHACSACSDVCKVPLQFYRYSIFGSQSEPEIFVEPVGGIDFPVQMQHKPAEFDDLRKELKIELARLSDDEILEFQDMFQSLEDRNL